MKLQITELGIKNEQNKRKKKWKKALLICILILMVCIVGQFVVDNTIGRFPDIYQAIDFNNDYEREDIVRILYGNTTATVIYKKGSGYGTQCYYNEDGLWVHSDTKTQEVDIENGTLIFINTKKGNEWGLKVLIYSKRAETLYDNIADAFGTDFYQYSDTMLLRRYYAYIYPESENYQVTVNGTTYSVTLKQFDS